MVYACARDGFAVMDEGRNRPTPPLDTLLNHVRLPPTPRSLFRSRWRPWGTIISWDELLSVDLSRKYRKRAKHADAPGRNDFRVNRLMNFLGLKRVDVAKPMQDIIALAGIDDVTVGKPSVRAQPDAMEPIPMMSRFDDVYREQFPSPGRKENTSPAEIFVNASTGLEHDVSLRVKPRICSM